MEFNRKTFASKFAADDSFPLVNFVKRRKSVTSVNSVPLHEHPRKKIIMNTPLRLGNKLGMEIKANVHNDIAH